VRMNQGTGGTLAEVCGIIHHHLRYPQLRRRSTHFALWSDETMENLRDDLNKIAKSTTKRSDSTQRQRNLS